MADAASTLKKIQQGVKETEHLIGQKQYNMAMIKSRQTLEYIVKALGDKACIVDGDMSDIIDQLYDGQWISKTTKDRYHKLRIIGNKAVHEGNDNPADATQAFRILSQEYQALTEEFAPRRRKPSGGSPNNSVRKRGKQKKTSLVDIFKILIPILCVILLIFVIRIFLPDPKTDETEPTTKPPVETSTEAPQPSTSEPPETTETPETSTEETTAVVIYKTTTTVNVRSEPSTDSRILVQLLADTEVNVIGTYDAQWSKILYEGQEAYIATAYLTQ